MLVALVVHRLRRSLLLNALEPASADYVPLYHSKPHATLAVLHLPSSLAPSCSISAQVARTFGTQAAAEPAAGVAS